MNVWPASLPQVSLLDNYQRTMADTRMRSPVDAGPSKMRRRFSYMPEPFRCAFIMTTEQRATFEAFVNDALQGGTLPFQMPAVDRSGTWIVQMANSMPTFSPYQDTGKWRVDLDMINLPQTS